MVMRYLLDTNIWIFYLKNSSSLVGHRLRNTSASDIAVCSVVLAELLHGARKYEKRAERVARVELTLSPFISLPFDDAAARHYAEIRDDLESRGATIGPNDMMIAAIVRTHGLILVSNNREFNRVPGIKTEDWTIE
jgi:tRNA(fMet)-specific endonuclease VapC